LEVGVDEKTKAAAWSQIRQFGDPVLKEESRPAEPSDEVRRLAERMIKIMYASDGVGLAAPQIGILQRVIVYRFGDEEPQVLLNPEIIWKSEETITAPEGCLSLASLAVDVPRAAQVKVRGQNLEGKECLCQPEGLEARILQHEIDHLNGILIIDRTTRKQRKDLMARLRQMKMPGEE